MNYISLIKPIMLQASAMLMAHFRQPIAKRFKYVSGGVQTNVDVLIEDFLKKELLAAFPGSGFIAEETKEKNIQKFTWIIDPIDGTANFVRGLPYFCINVALMYEEEIIAAMTVQPYGNDLFYAQKGHGFWWNDSKIDLNQHKNNDRRLVIVVSDWLLRQSDVLNSIRVACKNEQQEVKFRVNGAVALDLALCAAGVFDACIFQNLSIWDVAPALLYLPEAGGVMIDDQVKPANTASKSFMAGKKEVVDQICTVSKFPV